MRAESLQQAIEWQNATDFGLTAGIHTLDPQEVALWRDQVQAGNLYINRPITGAIVQRQPFGGWKHSSIGPGAKAGGPNYVANFCRISDDASVSSPEVAKNYQQAWDEHFSAEHDLSALKSESNVFRYRPCRGVILRLPNRDDVVLERAKLAAKLTGARLTISIATEETDEVFAARLPQLAKEAEFLRTIAAPGDAVLRAAHSARLNWIDAPLTANGRQELRFWLREQAVTRTRHRYGQLPEWQPEDRRALLNGSR